VKCVLYSEYVKASTASVSGVFDADVQGQLNLLAAFDLQCRQFDNPSDVLAVHRPCVRVSVTLLKPGGPARVS